MRLVHYFAASAASDCVYVLLHLSGVEGYTLAGGHASRSVFGWGVDSSFASRHPKQRFDACCGRLPNSVQHCWH